MFSTVEDVNERRLRVLRLHVEELNRQAASRDAALSAAQAKLKDLEQQRAAAQPQERKLFAKVEQQQAEQHEASVSRRLGSLLEKSVGASCVAAPRTYMQPLTALLRCRL